MLNVLNKIVAQRKQCTFSNSIKTTQKKPTSSYFIKLCEYWGTFQSSYKTKKSSMEKIMRLILGGSNYIGQTHVRWTNAFIFATFFNTEKIRLN